MSSDISLNDLRYTVGEKLGRFPGQVLLQYQLDSDKAKAGATSIQMDEELNIFKMKMRDLIMPQRLANGKLSVKSGSTLVGGLVKSGRKRTKEKGRGLDKGLVRPELRPIGFNDKGVEH